jgi:hypothetical protein
LKLRELEEKRATKKAQTELKKQEKEAARLMNKQKRVTQKAKPI